MGRNPGWSDRVCHAATAFVVTAAAPTLAYRARWPTRLRGRALAAYIACNTLIGFALRWWAVPWLKRAAEKRELARAQLAQALGREPTDDEFFEHLGLTCRRG